MLWNIQLCLCPSCLPFMRLRPVDAHQWIDQAHQRRPPKMIVLDTDSSESPTVGEQEGSTYNGHFGCTCYRPLFVFNQFGNVERCPEAGQRAQRRRLARGAGASDRPLPSIVKRFYFRATRLSPIPRCVHLLFICGCTYCPGAPKGAYLGNARLEDTDHSFEDRGRVACGNSVR
jgi:hypothetical protein